MASRILVMVVLVLCSGCVSTRHTLVNPSAQRYEPVDVDEVWIVVEESELDSLDYVRIAIIEASGSGEFTNQTGMLNAIRKKAAEVGANAVLLPQIDEPGAGAKVAAAIFGAYTQRRGSAIAIRVFHPNDS